VIVPAAKLTQLNLYPIKSCGGYSVERANLETRGLEGDRRYMLVDEGGRFLSQRTHPQMALLQAQPDGVGYVVTSPHQMPLSLPAVLPGDGTRRVTVWRDDVTATLASNEINEWFSSAVGISCQLVYMNKPRARRVKAGYGRPEDDLSFADGAPAMLISLESLVDLNRRLDKPVEMKRFRPNLVVTGGRAYAEDGWQRIRLGEAEFDVAWPCTRCTIPTVDPATGERDSLGEPIEKLKTFRRSRSGVTFGQNLIPRRVGCVQVGDLIEITESSG
jgi:uncharacterized protein YcbX